MPSTLNIKDILSQVKILNKQAQFTLLERPVALLRRQDYIAEQ